jgi:putative methyltransferase (TIGR04325 family)
MNITKVINGMLPPTMKTLIRGTLSRFIGFVEVGSWAEAQKAVAGYESDTAVESIIESIQQAHASSNETKALTSRDLQIISSFAIAIAAVGVSNTKIKVVDVGGAGGDYFFMFANAMPAVTFDWVVVETPALAKAITKTNLGKGRDIRWVSSLDEAGSDCDVALLSSVMQYVDDPYGLLNEVSNRCKVMVINRIPLTSSETDQATVQHVRTHGRRGAYPAWFFGTEVFIGEIQRIGDIMSRWAVPEDSHVLKFQQIESQGMVVLVKPQPQ